MPRRVNFSGDEIVALRDRRGLVTVLLAAELVLTTWGGRPRMPGHIINFKDGNHHNLEVDNLEWVPDHADAPDGVP